MGAVVMDQDFFAEVSRTVDLKVEALLQLPAFVNKGDDEKR